MATLAERAAAAQARLTPKTEQQSTSSTPSAPVKLSKALQAEADNEVPFERIELDGLAVLKILQHANSGTSTSVGASSSSSSSAGVSQVGQAGFLFGLSLGDRLSISNAVALPANHLLPSSITTLSNVSLSQSQQNADERTKAGKVVSEREKEVDAAYRNGRNFIANYIPRAKELNLDDELVGGYFVSKEGNDLLKEGVLVDILVRYQFGIGAGQGAAGSAPVSSLSAGADKKGQTARYRSAGRGNRRSVAIVYDASSSTSASLDIKAYTLAPAFLSLFESSSSFSSHRFDYASLASVGLTPSTLLVSYPVTITSSALLTAFLASNSEAQSLAASEHSQTYTALSADDSLEANLRSLLGALDSANSSIQSLGYQGRAARFGGSSGNADNLNKLESLKTIGVAEGVAKSLSQEAGLGTVRAWGARSSFVQ